MRNNDPIAWFQQQIPQMVSDLRVLCDLNSGSYHLDGLKRVEERLVDFFAILEWPLLRVELPEWQEIDDSGIITRHRTSRALRWDWTGSKAGVETPRLLLSIHYDTVYGPDNPFQTCSPFEHEQSSCLRGPGVIDAKGGIVIIRWALLGAQHFLDMSRLKLSVILTPDEEIGSPATVSLWRKIASEFQFGMLYEPTLPDGTWVSHRKGTGTFLLIVRGKSAHSGRNFHDGRNAILHAAKIAVDVDALNGIRTGVTINVGRIRGGDAVNVVPDLCTMRVNVRVSNQEDQNWIESEMQRVVSKWNQQDAGYRVELSGGILSGPKELTEDLKPWMKMVEEVSGSLGHPVQWKLSGGASDGNKLAAFGLPNIDTFGPEGDQLHTDQEWLRVDSLAEKANLSMSFIQRVCLGPK